MTCDVHSPHWSRHGSQRRDGPGRQMPGGSTPKAVHEAKVLPFRRAHASRPGDRIIVDPIVYFARLEERRRMRQNLAAGAIVLAIVVTGLWLIDHLRAGARVMECLEAGHANCVPLDLTR